MTPRESAARSWLNAMWSMVLRPWKPRPAVAIDRFGPRADWSAARRRSGVALRCPIRWLKISHHDEARSGSPFQQSGQASQILLVVLPHPPVPVWTHSRAGVGNADADDRYLTNAGLGDAGHKSPGRERCMANSSHWLPGRSGPQQDLPSALLTLSEGLTPVVLGADGVAILRQLQARGVRLGETDDVRSVLTNAALYAPPLSTWARPIRHSS